MASGCASGRNLIGALPKNEGRVGRVYTTNVAAEDFVCAWARSAQMKTERSAGTVRAHRDPYASRTPRFPASCNLKPRHCAVPPGSGRSAPETGHPARDRWRCKTRAEELVQPRWPSAFRDKFLATGAGAFPDRVSDFHLCLFIPEFRAVRARGPARRMSHRGHKSSCSRSIGQHSADRYAANSCRVRQHDSECLCRRAC